MSRCPPYDRRPCFSLQATFCQYLFTNTYAVQCKMTILITFDEAKRQRELPVCFSRGDMSPRPPYDRRPWKDWGPYSQWWSSHAHSLTKYDKNAISGFVSAISTFVDLLQTFVVNASWNTDEQIRCFIRTRSREAEAYSVLMLCVEFWRCTINDATIYTLGLSLSLVGTVRAEPEAVISRVQSPDPGEYCFRITGVHALRLISQIGRRVWRCPL